ncbi:peptidoglycan-binding domain-containing protein [Roseibacterium sp. SDUM158017]|uniref:peptidoglycan-binding domain-containing protein n=1 Tax=Roseicyclus salinarum TaxID=3036773 RepID=UPI002414FD12|nr:peptidoglycan-binding domain-containing protein [Roseibacterium sp. SDUM158017]MDG4649405.1 peptidoglycan-binding domain-containing protein [Roseibacterium sp. SDUM158017]
MIRFIITLFLLLCIGAPQVASADTALILSNERYAAAANLRGMRALPRLEDDLARAGFDVILVRNGSAEDLRAGLSRLLEAAEDERVLIVAGGHFVRGGSESWLLGSDAGTPDLATVSRAGVEVSGLLEVAASAPGRAVVALASGGDGVRAGSGLRVGIGRVEPPQGVTVVAGPPDAVARFVAGPLLTPGEDLPAALGASPELQATGFLSSAISYFPRTQEAGPAIPDEDLALWRAVDSLGTPEAYRVYLDRFPRGDFAERARARLAAPPSRGPEAQEADLDLTLGERREVQGYLTILGHDTRGVDGIFGPATRRAIAAWQTDRGLPASGFLTGRQVETLRREGEIREAVLAEERRAGEREDRAWWEATGAGRSLEGMRDYLARYPDGLFAEEARSALSRDAWDRAREADTVQGYRRFVEDWPDSRQAAEARARIRELQGGGVPDAGGEAQAREAAMNLPSITRLLVEQRLARLGLDPGRVDGTFDADTRAAIRDYQEDRGIPASGYLDQSMLALLLAGSLGEILR